MKFSEPQKFYVKLSLLQIFLYWEACILPCKYQVCFVRPLNPNFTACNWYKQLMIMIIFDVGSEYDFVIFSTVRSLPRRTISNRAAVQPDRAWIREHLGFITDRHQICVGITRAKHGLVIVGECV